MPLGSVDPLPPPFTSFAQYKEALDEYYSKSGGMGANNPRIRRPYRLSYVATERMNTHDGTLTNVPVGQAVGIDAVDPATVLA